MIAALYDVHGNLAALEAVLADAERRGASTYVIGGDVALFGPWPAETLPRLEALTPAVWIRGNGERWTGDPDAAPDTAPVRDAIAAARDELGTAATERLAALPESAVLDGIRFCHASPRSDVEGFDRVPPDDVENDRRLLAGAHEHRVVFGHTHIQFERPGPDGRRLLNPGSVGMPFDGDPRAAYALLDRSGATELRRVAYDHEAAARALEERFAGRGAHPAVVAQRLRRARFE